MTSLTCDRAEVAPLRQRSSGQSLAAVLAGAWRPSPPMLDMPAQELDEITQHLIGSGAGGLAWWRIRYSDMRTSP
ncbi:MAG: hypothetical protein ACREOH_15780, partial [Candidatus Entotheonellia bacterium]